MSESEKLIRAKIYVDNLANGINPIDDSEIPSGNLINDVRLSRCFFFLSDVLRQERSPKTLKNVRLNCRLRQECVFPIPKRL